MARSMRRPRLLFVGVFLLGAMFAGSGIVIAATVVKTGKAVTAVKVVTETGPAGWFSPANFPNDWTDVAGMSTTISVPTDQRALLLITFSAETVCTDSNDSPDPTLCSLRVLVNGNPALPGEVKLDSAGGTWEASSMQFVVGPLNAGSHTIKVQGLLNENVASFTFGPRTLSVLRSRV